MLNQNGFTFYGPDAQIDFDREIYLRELNAQRNANNIATGYMDSAKKYANYQEETNLNNSLFEQQYYRSQFPWHEPCCAPPVEETFDWSLLPEELSSFVEYMHELTGWPKFPVLLADIGAISSALRGRYIVKVGPSWHEPLILQNLVSSPSGTMKSFLVEQMKAPFIEFEEGRNVSCKTDTLSGTDEAIDRFREILLKREIDTIIKESRNDEFSLDYGEIFAQVSRKRAEIEESSNKYIGKHAHPIRLFADSFTDVKLIREMAKQGGGFSLFKAEGNAFLNMVNNPRSNLDILLQGYTMETLSHMTQSGGETHIRKPFLNILYIVQSKILANIYKNEHFKNIGLTSRFLPYFVREVSDPITRENFGGKQVYARYRDLIHRLLNRLYTQSAAREIFELALSKEANQEMLHFMKWVNEQKENMSEDLHPFMDKLRGSAVRIAGVLHAAIYPEPEAHEISQLTTYTGIQIACAIIPHAEYAHSPSGLCAYEDAQKILKWMRQHGHRIFDSRQIAQGVANMKNVNIDPALELLDRHNIICRAPSPGHPTKCAVHLHFR